MRTRTLIAAASLAALTLLAACGDDSSSDSAGGDTTAAAVETTAGETDSTETSAASGGGTGNFTEYCALIQQYMDDSDSMDAVFNAEVPDPAAMEEAFTTMQGQLQNLADQAPEEIADDVNKVNEATTQMIELFDSFDYDVNKLGTDPEAIAKFQELTANTDFNDAAARLDEWGATECGFSS